MGLPEVKDNYIVVSIDQSRHWFIPTMGKQWRHIEQSFRSEGDLGSLILASGLRMSITKQGGQGNISHKDKEKMSLGH